MVDPAAPLPFTERFKVVTCAACKRWSWAVFAACAYCGAARSPSPAANAAGAPELLGDERRHTSIRPAGNQLVP